MSHRVDLYDSTYGHFSEHVLAAVRRETYGEDIGQNSWLTAEEYDRFVGWLGLAPAARLLEVACGSGGPALYIARKHGCRIIGIDVNEKAIATASQAAVAGGADAAVFQVVDADGRLPFDDASFDAIACIDSLNHLRDRLGVLREWHRVLRPGRRILFTDPVVITGPVTSEELAVRSSIGSFLFVPLEVTDQYLADAGFRTLRREDVTDNAVRVSGRWRAARQVRREDLVRIEGEERFEGLQKFLGTVHHLASERRLSRFVFVAEKPA